MACLENIYISFHREHIYLYIDHLYLHIYLFEYVFPIFIFIFVDISSSECVKSVESLDCFHVTSEQCGFQCFHIKT